MQPTSAALATAIEARERQPLIRLKVDWDRDGSYDTTAQVVGEAAVVTTASSVPGGGGGTGAADTYGAGGDIYGAGTPPDTYGAPAAATGGTDIQPTLNYNQSGQTVPSSSGCTNSVVTAVAGGHLHDMGGAAAATPNGTSPAVPAGTYTFWQDLPGGYDQVRWDTRPDNDTQISLQPALGLNPDQVDAAIVSDLNHLQSIGVKGLWLVGAFEWASTGNGTWDSYAIGRYDKVISEATARGMPIILQAHGNPSWNVTAGGHTYPGSGWHGPDNATERANWVTILHNFIARYGASVFSHIEVWNEPNITEFWLQGPSPDNYVRLLHDCYADLKATWPTLKVAGHNMSRNDHGWLNTCITTRHSLYGTGSLDMDVCNTHPYAGPNSIGTGYVPSDNTHGSFTGAFGLVYLDFLGYRQLRSLLLANGYSLPLAFGEFGYSTTSGTSFFEATESNRAFYIPLAMELAAADGYVEYINIYYHRPGDAPAASGFNIHPSTGATATETAFAAKAATLGGAGYYWALQGSLRNAAGTGNGNTWYAGLQSRSPNPRGIIFSIWNADTGVAGTIPGTLSQPFGGEGEGWQLLADYAWVAGRTYQIRVVAEGSRWFGAYFKDLTTSIETYLGSIRATVSDGSELAGVAYQWTELFSQITGTGGDTYSDTYSDTYAGGAAPAATCPLLPRSTTFFGTPTFTTDTSGGSVDPGSQSVGTIIQTVPLDDLSADVVSAEFTSELATDLPPQAKLFAGSAAATATITLAHQPPVGSPHMHTAWWYSPLNPASPLFGKRRRGAPAILEFGFVGANGPEYVRKLTGRVRSLQVTSGGRQAVMRISDFSEDMRRQVTLPMIIADGDIAGPAVSRPGLNTTFLADWVARRCGYYASPPQRPGCKFLATMHGSGYPEVGRIEGHHGEHGSKLAYSPTPEFPATAKWVQAVNTDGSSGQALRYFLGGSGTISTNNTRTALVQGWWKSNNTSTDDPHVIVFADFATSAPFFCLWWQASTGQLKLNFNRGGADNVGRTATGPTVSFSPSDRVYFAAHVSFTSTGVSVTFRHRVGTGAGVTTGPVFVATPSVTNAPACTRVQVNRGLVSNFADAYLNGLAEDVQVTTEPTPPTTPWWGDNFTPTAQIVPSSAIDNRLVATPAVSEDGWTLFQELAESEFATAGFTETGTLFYWSRRRWTTSPYTTSQRTLTATTALKELETVEAIDQVRNRIVIRSRAPEVTDQQTVWKLGGRVRIGANSSRVIWASLNEPVGNVDTTVNYGTTLGSSRYLAGTRLDGQGDQVSNLSFNVEVLSPTSIKTTVTNPNNFTIFLAGDENASTAYNGKPYYWIDAQLVKFGQEGTGTNERAEATSSLSIARYGEQLLELEDSDFRQDADDIQAIANDLVADLAEPGPALSDVPVVGDPRIQLGDRLTIVDPDGLAFTSDFHCAKVDLTFDGEGLGMVLSLRKA